MRYTKKLAIVLLLFSVFGCTISRKNEMYKKFKNEVSSEVFSSFPIKTEKDIDSSFIQILNFPNAFISLKYCGLFIVYKYDSVKYIEAVNKIEKNNIKRLNINDTCNILIPLNDNIGIKRSDKNTPIPNLFDTSIGIDSLISKKNSTYYIFNSGWGEFINEKNYYPISKLKRERTSVIENGFSNGAFSDPENNIIIYWIIIW